VTPVQELASLFGCAEAPPEPPNHFNIAPTQPVAVVRIVRQAGSGRELAVVRWGLIPSWADDPSIGNRLINARSETAAEKPSFRNALRHRRCLIPADGFYEWQAAGQGQRKQPFVIRMKDHKPFALAGLWETWTSADGGVIESCTILTTDANDCLRPIHDRMPVIMAPEDCNRWLDPASPLGEVQALLHPFPAEGMESYPVATLVNDPKHETAKCLAALQ